MLQTPGFKAIAKHGDASGTVLAQPSAEQPGPLPIIASGTLDQVDARLGDAPLEKLLAAQLVRRRKNAQLDEPRGCRFDEQDHSGPVPEKLGSPIVAAIATEDQDGMPAADIGGRRRLRAVDEQEHRHALEQRTVEEQDREEQGDEDDEKATRRQVFTTLRWG
ncbi:MAG: hypothetical protein WD278_07900 [Pirellulales bacterium]